MKNISRREAVAVLLIGVLLVTSGVVLSEIVLNSGPNRVKAVSQSTQLDYDNETGVDWVNRSLQATVVADDTPRVATYNVSMTMSRAVDDPVFEYRAHDVAMAKFKTTTVLLAHIPEVTLYQNATAGVPTSASRWRPRAFGSMRFRKRPVSSSIDTAVFAEGIFIGYSDGHIYRLIKTYASDANRNNVSFAEDPGVFYDGKTVHMFFEAGNTSTHSGTKIGHATSPNGIDNWTVHQPVYTSPDEFRSGDYAIVETNGLYFIFGDYTKNHPRYNVSVWVNDDLSSEFTRLGTVMIPIGSEIGVQDVAIQYDPIHDRYVVFAQSHRKDGKPLHYALGQINVTKQQADDS